MLWVRIPSSPQNVSLVSLAQLVRAPRIRKSLVRVQQKPQSGQHANAEEITGGEIARTKAPQPENCVLQLALDYTKQFKGFLLSVHL